MSEVILVKAVQTCSACPSQWDAWDDQGNYWYLRYRFAHGTAEQQSGPDPRGWRVKSPEFSFDTSDETDPLDGLIDLGEFCERAGLTLRLRSLGGTS